MTRRDGFPNACGLGLSARSAWRGDAGRSPKALGSRLYGSLMRTFGMSQSGGAAGSKGPPGRAVTLGFADQAADAGQRIGDDLEHLEARGLDRPG